MHNFSLIYVTCKNKNEFGNELSKRILRKNNIFINAKWHRVCFTPAYIINKKQCDYLLDCFIKEFKALSNSWI